MTTNKISKNNLAVSALVFVAFSYTLLSISSRLLNQGFEPMTQVYARIFLGFLLSLVFFRNKLRFEKIKTTPKKDICWLLIMGTLGYSISVYFMTLGALNTKLLNVAVIFALIPFIVYIYSIFLLHEKIRLNLFALLAISLAGVSLIASQSIIPNFSKFGIGEFYMLLAVIFAGWWSVGRKMLSPHLNNAEISSAVMFIAFISGLSIALLKGESFNISALSNNYVLIGLFLGSTLNLVSTYAENFAFGQLDVVFGNQLLLTENIFAIILGYIFYQEVIGLSGLVGAFLILISVYFANKIFKSG